MTSVRGPKLFDVSSSSCHPAGPQNEHRRARTPVCMYVKMCAVRSQARAIFASHGRLAQRVSLSTSTIVCVCVCECQNACGALPRSRRLPVVRDLAACHGAVVGHFGQGGRTRRQQWLTRPRRVGNDLRVSSLVHSVGVDRSTGAVAVRSPERGCPLEFCSERWASRDQIGTMLRIAFSRHMHCVCVALVLRWHCITLALVLHLKDVLQR